MPAALLDEARLRRTIEHTTALRLQVMATLTLMAAVVWAGGAHPVAVASWLVLALLARECRTWSLRRLLAAGGALPIGRRMAIVTYWSIAIGLTHGAICLFLPKSDSISALVTLVLVSMCAASVSAAYTIPAACVGYLAAVSGSLAIAWSARAHWEYIGIGILVLLFTSALMRLARHNLADFKESFLMGEENRELLGQVMREREQLTQARDAALRADRSKSVFLAAASHDLRQPLQSLSLNCSALLRLPIQGEAREIAREMAASVEGLRLMLIGLLDLSQLDLGGVKPRLNPFPLAAVVGDCCARFRPAAQAKGLQLDGHCDPQAMVMSDIEMLRRILSNLLDNAIKYTTEGSIRVEQSGHQGQVRLTVRDTGCGIEPQDMAHVFEDLVQLNNPQRDRAFGNGLGLGIVRRLVRLLGIDCHFASEPGRGTTVTLDIPARRGSHHVMASAPSVQPALVGRRLLVLDDSAEVRAAYTHALTALGCSVCSAATLAQAHAMLGSAPVDVVLVDFRLADDIDGLQAIQRLREADPDLAAVLVTADSSEQIRADAARLKVPFLRKPVTDLTLAMAVEEALVEKSRATTT